MTVTPKFLFIYYIGPSNVTKQSHKLDMETKHWHFETSSSKSLVVELHSAVDQLSYFLCSIPSGAFTSTLLLPISLQLVLRTVPQDSDCKNTCCQLVLVTFTSVTWVQPFVKSFRKFKPKVQALKRCLGLDLNILIL